MKAILDDGVFGPPHAAKDLRFAFDLADQRGHRLELSAPDGPRFAAWLASLGRETADDYRGFLDDCLTLEDQEPARVVVQVTPGPASDWNADPPAITLQDAIRILDRPFRLLVENDDSDVQFLRCVLREEWRRELDRAIARGRAEWEHRGGVPNMKEPVLRAKDRPDLARSMWLMFDSDAMYPRERGEDVDDLVRKCLESGVRFHCLERRAIENYLPRAALSAWAEAGRQHRGVNLGRVETFFGPYMSSLPARRHHYHMKSGFQKDWKDEKNKAKARDLYDGMPDEVRRALNAGFAKDVREWFRTEHVDEAALRDDGSWSELEAFARELIALLR